MPLSFSPKFVDMVRVMTSTQGTGPLVCGSAVSGYASFAESVAAGDSFYYSVQGIDRTGEREVGRGTYLANGTISRQPLNGTLTNFTAGQKTIALVTAAEWFAAVQSASASAQTTAASRVALAAVPVASGATSYLTEAGREGAFVWDASVPASLHQSDAAQGIFVAPSASSSGAWVRRYTGPVNVRWFGAKADGLTNDGASFVGAIAVLKAMAVNDSGATYKGSSELFVPAGNYYLGTTTLNITHTLVIQGESTGMAGGYATRLKWDANCGGIRLYRYNTEGAGHLVSSPTHYGADGAQIRGLLLEGNATGGNAEYHAVEMHCRAVVEDCAITAWRGDGINIVATAGGGTGVEGNANCFEVRRCRISQCRNGIYLFGADANAGLITMVDSSSNRSWGINDESFLGNNLIACHTAANGAGSYRTVNANAQPVLQDCYAEGDQPKPSLAPNTLVLGGTWGSGIDTGVWMRASSAGNLVSQPVGGALEVKPVSGTADVEIHSANNLPRLRFLRAGSYRSGLAYVNPGMGYDVPTGEKHVFYTGYFANSCAEISESGLKLGGGDTLKAVITLTQASYDALSPKDANTLYLITA